MISLKKRKSPSKSEQHDKRPEVVSSVYVEASNLRRTYRTALVYLGRVL